MNAGTSLPPGWPAVAGARHAAIPDRGDEAGTGRTVPDAAPGSGEGCGEAAAGQQT
jgi:hypothetical protein